MLIATGAYSFLFYQQNAGINFLIFNVVLIIILVLKNVKLLKDKKWLWAVGLCLVSSSSIFVHSSALAIIGNVFSLMLLSAFSFNSFTSSIFSFLFSCYTVITCMVYIVVDSVGRVNASSEIKTSKSGYKVLSVFVVIVLSIVFFALYKSSNPLFAENTKWINLDFISIFWIFFTLGGFFLVYAFLNHKTIYSVETWENNLAIKNGIASQENEVVKQYDVERFAGLLLFILLNAMLVILNVGDIQTLYFNGGLPKNVSHSDFVHDGVGVIIFSILIATSLIMFLFRKEFTSIKNNKALVACVFLWIGQNILMLSSTAFRNQIYIHDYNFTYKRIGVYVWLVLAIIGLLIMFWRIYKKQSNWYLIRTNGAVWFTVLVFSSVINWDLLITNYNIKNKPLLAVDFHYLFSLSDSNLPELIAIIETKNFHQLDPKLRDYSSYNRMYYGETFSQLLNQKKQHFLESYTNDWRSFDLRDKRIVESLIKK